MNFSVYICNPEMQVSDAGKGGWKPLLQTEKHIAEIAQLVEHNLAKVGVASSSLVFRSRNQQLTEMKLLIFLSIYGRKQG